MSSSSRCCATGVFVLPSLLLLPLFLSLVCGATLREHRLSGAEPVSYGSASEIRPPPSAEMLRALRYIQSLSQRTPPDPLADDGQEAEDMEGVRSMLQMAAPARMDRGMEEREDEKDKTQELLQAVLTTLKQTEEHMVPQKTPQKVITTPRYAVSSFPRPKQQLEVLPSGENYGRNSWGNSDNRRQHRFPLMFEDEDDQEQPLKRTNENAEEQYTPQKLATLQSVFEELSGITASKANSKRDDDEDDDDNDLYRQRKMILEDIMGTDDWTPLEEQLESEEEQRERHEFNRNLEDDEDQEEEEDDNEVKRSKQSDWFKTRKEEEPEDMAKLVDYYLLQILEKKEQEQQKRQASEEEAEKKDVDEDEDDDEEEEEEKREIKPMHSMFPESLSQVLKISQKLQIPPEEVLELLQNEKRKDSPNQSRMSYTNPHKTFAAAPHRRPLETSDNSIAQDILSILEMVSAAQQYGKRPTQPKTSRYYQRETGRDDYDDTAGGDDELANYLASQMFTQGQRHARLTPSQDHDQPMYGNLERAVQDYFKKSTPEKRPPEHENTDTGIDNNTMMKILRYLDPETDDVDETDSEDKTVPEM